MKRIKIKDIKENYERIDYEFYGPPKRFQVFQTLKGLPANESRKPVSVRSFPTRRNKLGWGWRKEKMNELIND